MQVVTHSMVNLLPNNELALGQSDTHFLFTESLNLFLGHDVIQVLFVVSEKYPVGQLVTHLLVKGLEK